MGVLDLAAPLLAFLHGWLEPWVPPAIEIALWASLCAWVSMWLYRRLSRQQQLLALKGEVRAATQELAGYEGDFSGMLTKVTQALRLTLRQLRLTTVPAVLASLPVLFVLTWLSNAFDYALPPAGQMRTVTVSAREQVLLWPPGAAVSVRQGEWQVIWPDRGHPITVRDHNGRDLFTLPLATPIPVLHKRAAWNWLVGNPAGYLPGQGAVDAVEISLPALEIIGGGPPWLRNWLTSFLFVLVAGSLWLKVKWRLH